MKKLCAVVTLLLAVSFSWAQAVYAQERKAVPVEFFACNWQDGKGMSDLAKVIEKFGEYADKNDSGYSAWALTPQFTNDPDGAFDVGWLGSWPDIASFGKSQDNWMAKGGDVAKDFAAVVDCSGRHELASSVVLNPPEQAPTDGVVMFYACTLNDGKTGEDAIAAGSKLAAAMKTLGSSPASWIFFPGLGAGNIDFDYWRVIAFSNYADLAASAEVYLNGGGWKKTQEILGPVASCSSPAVFDARLARAAKGS